MIPSAAVIASNKMKSQTKTCFQKKSWKMKSEKCTNDSTPLILEVLPSSARQINSWWANNRPRLTSLASKNLIFNRDHRPISLETISHMGALNNSTRVVKLIILIPTCFWITEARLMPHFKKWWQTWISTQGMIIIQLTKTDYQSLVVSHSILTLSNIMPTRSLLPETASMENLLLKNSPESSSQRLYSRVTIFQGRRKIVVNLSVNF